jgi:hypothetical protein
MLQSLQCSLSDSRWISQPVSANPSQSAKPDLHEKLHKPSVQLICALSATQVLPQLPQFEMSVCTSAQAPSQFCLPLGHSPLQVPESQTWSAAQALPQLPQLACVWMFSHSGD